MINPHSKLPFAAAVHPQARPALHLTWDSREAGPDTAFVALAGAVQHGNVYLRQALDAGAPFVLTDLQGAAQQYERAVEVADSLSALKAWAQTERRRSPLVVGITGSVGKTTAKSYVAAALDAAYMPVYNTIPAIACFLVEYGASGRPLVVEMGIDHVGEMAELMALVSPDVGVVTSIGAAHLEGLESVAVVAREKSGILTAPEGYVGLQAAAWCKGTPTYGFSSGDDVVSISGQNLRLSEQGAAFEFDGHEVFVPLAGRVQAEAAVLGLHLARQTGLDLQAAVRRIAAVKVPQGRYQIHSGRFTVIDDAYNASPLAVHAALSALSNFQQGRRIAVLGTMLELGVYAPELHREVGNAACECADLCFGVGPYAELLGEHVYATVPELTAALLETVRDGDVILVKASRGISMTPEQRAREGVGLDTVVQALLQKQAEVISV